MTRTAIAAMLLAALAASPAAAYDRYVDQPAPVQAQQGQQVFFGDGQIFGHNIVPQTCSEADTRSRVVGGALGAVLGGLLGSSIGGGSGKTAATIAGTALGIVVGSTAGGYVHAQNPDCDPALQQTGPGRQPQPLFGAAGWVDHDNQARR
jgi:outer membrane lipoprotein SlyB